MDDKKVDPGALEPEAIFNPRTTFERIVLRALEVHRKKASDYANGSDYGNFTEIERAAPGATGLGILSRMSDKWTRLMNLWARGGEAAVVDENLDDTLLDLANYTLILLAHREDSRQARSLGASVDPAYVKLREEVARA